MRNPFVRVPLSIPNGSRDHPEGLAQAFGPSPERVGEGTVESILWHLLFISTVRDRGNVLE